MPCALSDSSILALFASNANNRAVTKVSSCQVYTVYRGSAMCCIFLLVPIKVARGHDLYIVAGGNPWSLALKGKTALKECFCIIRSVSDCESLQGDTL